MSGSCSKIIWWQGVKIQRGKKIGVMYWKLLNPDEGVVDSIRYAFFPLAYV